MSRFCVGKTTKTNHYWWSRDGSLLLKAFKGEWERKKKGRRTGPWFQLQKAGRNNK